MAPGRYDRTTGMQQIVNLRPRACWRASMHRLIGVPLNRTCRSTGCRSKMMSVTLTWRGTAGTLFSPCTTITTGFRGRCWLLLMRWVLRTKRARDIVEFASFSPAKKSGPNADVSSIDVGLSADLHVAGAPRRSQMDWRDA